MKREDLWVLLGEAPTEMIEEASTASTGKKDGAEFRHSCFPQVF